MPRGKTNAIEQLINGKYAGAAEVTVKQLATEVGCTVQNVYIYIRKNPSRFSQVRRGVYKVSPAVSSATVANNNSGTVNA
jgi:hypothetical protein